MKTRLFLFAAYDKDGVVGEALQWYLKSLAHMGELVFVADSYMSAKELEKLAPYCLHAEAVHHGEYDFGSYKRAYIWAKDNLDLSSYDHIYLVNDSVYGPLFDIYPYVLQMEALGTEAFSFVLNSNKRHTHLQSWFIGLDKSVFTKQYFEDFILSVKKEDSKLDVCVKYETGLTELLCSNDVRFDALLKLSGRKIYNAVKSLYMMDFPFIKKSAFTRHNGCLGAQLLYVMNRVPEDCRTVVLEDARRVFGEKYIDSLLTSNGLVIAARYLKYLGSKLGLCRIS